MQNVRFMYEDIYTNKLDLRIGGKLLENENDVITQMAVRSDGYILVTVGQNFETFLNTWMTGGLYDNPFMPLDSIYPIYALPK